MTVLKTDTKYIDSLEDQNEKLLALSQKVEEQNFFYGQLIERMYISKIIEYQITEDYSSDIGRYHLLKITYSNNFFMQGDSIVIKTKKELKMWKKLLKNSRERIPPNTITNDECPF